MFFSIIIPVYNAEKYLEECLHSICNQSFQNFEVIIIDDGSTDGSGKICDDYAKGRENIIVIHQHNNGIAYARKIGLQQAHGEFVFFVDADDYILDNALVRVKTYIKTHKCDVVIFNYTDESGKIYRAWDMKPDFIYSDNKKKEVYKILCSDFYLNSLCRKVFRRALFDVNDELRSIDFAFRGEDLLISVPIFLRAKSIAYYDETFYYYRTNENSTTHTYNSKSYDNYKKVHRILRIYFDEQFATATQLLRKRFLKTVVTCVTEIVSSANQNKLVDLNNIAKDNYWKNFYLQEKKKLPLKDKIMLFMLYYNMVKALAFIGKCYFKLKAW